jgi:ADP-heptose:LPS heptosyltransferase
MKPLLERLPAGGRVAVIRLRSLGDCVLTTPALQILKETRPNLRVAVVVEPRFSAVFENNPHVDRILAPSVPAIARWRPDLAVNLHGGTRSIALTVASRAPYRAGFQRPLLRQTPVLACFGYTRRYLTSQRGGKVFSFLFVYD